VRLIYAWKCSIAYGGKYWQCGQGCMMATCFRRGRVRVWIGRGEKVGAPWIDLGGLG